MKKFQFALLFSLVIILGTNAQELAPLSVEDVGVYEKGTFTFQMDQDFLYVTPYSKNEDRNYTQGTAFVYSNPRLQQKFFLFYPQKKIYSWLKTFEHTASSITLGGTAFTPRIIDEEDPVIGDRPFAFLLYLSTVSVFKNNKAGTGKQDAYHSFKINYGLYGTNIGYAVQSFLHKYVIKGRPTDPKGWKHQISDGGAPALLLEYERFQSLTKNARWFDLAWSGGASVGYYDRIFTSAFFRAGKILPKNQAKWHWAFGATSSAQYENLMYAPKNKQNNFECFLYGKVTPTLMFRNASLVGQGFVHSDYTIDAGWAYVAGSDFEWGLMLGSAYTKKNKLKRWAIMLRQVIRTPEFNSGIYPKRWHYFGSAAFQFPLF